MQKLRTERPRCRQTFEGNASKTSSTVAEMKPVASLAWSAYTFKPLSFQAPSKRPCIMYCSRWTCRGCPKMSATPRAVINTLERTLNDATFGNSPFDPGKRRLYILLAETDRRLLKIRHNFTRIYRSGDEYRGRLSSKSQVSVRGSPFGQYRALLLYGGSQALSYW